MMGSMMTIGLMLKAYDNMSGVVSTASNKAITSLAGIGQQMKSLSGQAEQFGRNLAAEGMVISAAMAKPLTAYADLEDATTDLKVAMLDNLGRVPKQFEAINKQAVELGNLLPGTTADFIGAGRALIEQGTAFDTIINGGLKSSSYLSVLLKMPARDAAEMVAKLREAYGLADNELMKMADLTQRARFAFGMTPQDIKIASSYSGATQNILGLKGLDNAKKLLALQGLGAGVSLEGSSWGTNFAMLLARTAESKDRLAKNSKEMKAINADLKAYGITLDFFDQKGRFMGIDNLVRQLEKTQKMAQSDKLNLYKKLFGVEAGRPAAIIADKGWAGYQEALQKMEKQADLQKRIELSLSTLKNKWEALTGTMTNALAAVGEPIANLVAPFLGQLNALIGGPMMTWVEQNKTLVGVVGTGVLVLGGLLIVVGALSLVFGTGLRTLVGFGSGIGTLIGWSRSAVVWLAAQRLEVLRLTGAQRAQIAVQNLQNAVAYRGGVWQALQYALLTTRYRMQAMNSASRAWIVTMSGQLVGSIRGAVTAMRTWTMASLAWVRTAMPAMVGATRAWIVTLSGQLLGSIRGAVAAMRVWIVTKWTWIRTNLLTMAGIRGLVNSMAGSLLGRIHAATGAMRTWTLASWTWIRANLLTVAGLRGLAVSFAGSLVTGIKGATVAVRAFSLALLANPIGIAVAVIAGAAFLVYKYWRPIAAFFGGLWQGLKAGLAPLMPAFRQFAGVARAAFAPLMPPLRAVWVWLRNIFQQANDTGGAARSLGVAVGQGIASAIMWVGRLVKAVFELPGKFFDAGAAIVQGLWRGIQSLASKPVEAIKSIGANVAGAFKNLLGIRSPSRVFMGYGGNISQGAAIGIENSLPQVQQATQQLAKVTTQGMNAARAPFGKALLPGALAGLTGLGTVAGAPARPPILSPAPPLVLPAVNVPAPAPMLQAAPVVAGVAAKVPVLPPLPMVLPAPPLVLPAVNVKVPAPAPLLQAAPVVAGVATKVPVLPPTLPVIAPPLMVPAANVVGASRAHVGVYGPVRPAQSAPTARGATGGNLVVHFSPQIHVDGGGDVKRQVQAALKDGYREFEAYMRRYEADKKRRGF